MAPPVSVAMTPNVPSTIMGAMYASPNRVTDPRPSVRLSSPDSPPESVPPPVPVPEPAEVVADDVCAGPPACEPVDMSHIVRPRGQAALSARGPDGGPAAAQAGQAREAPGHRSPW